jgi:transcriptional regulator with XRE-family HTH domain
MGWFPAIYPSNATMAAKVALKETFLDFQPRFSGVWLRISLSVAEAFPGERAAEARLQEARMDIKVLETQAAPNQPANELGKRIRRLRKARERTLDSLAQEVGLTKGYLSKVETGRQMPPLATLSKVARALGTDLSSLLEPGAMSGNDESSAGVSLVRADQRRPVIRGGSSFGYDYQSLVQNASGRHMSPFLFTFPRQILKEVFFEHAGEELIFVLSGTVEFEVGSERYELKPGDCIYFDARMRHRGRGKGGEAKALVVMLEPHQGGD